MVLPTVTTFADCANFDKTVLAYGSQLSSLPARIFDVIGDRHALVDVYKTTNPLIFAFAFALFLAPVFLIVSEVNRNYSQVDRCWSILPTVYNAHYTLYAHLNGIPTRRLDILATVSAIWSVRLTYNYWRKGGYSIGSEDYRWEILRKYISPPLFFVFNVTFISLAQSILLFSITTPAYILLLSAKGTEGFYQVADVIFSRTIALWILLAFLADNQQWKFHQAKREYQKTAKVPAGFHQEDLDRGFNVTSMFSYSRHPNFAAEQAVWITLYGWAAWTIKGLVNWTIVGPIAYLILFQASTWFTELVSAKKYPEYKEYQKRVGMFLPRLPGGPPGDFSDQRKGETAKDK